MITFKYLLLGLTYLGFGLGYLPGLRMNRAAIAIVGSALAVALGSRRPQNCLAGDGPEYDRCLLAMAIVNTVNSTV
jgi:hypothetical protein